MNLRDRPGMASNCRRVKFTTNMTFRSLIAYVFALAWSTSAFADDIVLDRGKAFSVYSPSSCQKVEGPKFALVLDCNFHGKTAQFYLKEFPGQLNVDFDPRKTPPPKQYVVGSQFLTAALRTILDDIGPIGMIHRVKFLGGGSNTDDANALFWQEGYLARDSGLYGSQNVEKCVLVRVQSYIDRGLTAVLVALSDIDTVVLDNGPQRCVGVPREALTILGSLGGNFVGGRFMRLPEPDIP